MTQQVKNAMYSFAFDKVTELMEKGEIITPELITSWVDELQPTFKENGGNIGKARVRELLVCYIISEFDITAFGVPQNIKGPTQVSEKGIKKYKKLQKNGFTDLKLPE